MHIVKRAHCRSENCSGRRSVTCLRLRGPRRVGDFLACGCNVSSSHFPLDFVARNRNDHNVGSIAAMR